MEKDYWDKKWEIGDIRFHRHDVHPLLIQYFQMPPAKVMVPLCGKSLDILWLKEQGHQVIGCEFNEKACVDFFRENKLSYERSGHRFVSQGIEIYNQDFFTLPDSAWEGVRALYDRAALVALNPQQRTKYAQEILKRAKDFSYLLLTWEYPEGAALPPPYSVPEKEVRSLFGKNVEKILGARDPFLTSAPKFSNVEAQELAFWIRS